MSGKLSYDEARRLARIWAAEAQGKAAPDEAEIAAWSAEPRKSNHHESAATDGSPEGGTDGN
jgi:hypothetical protein